MSEADPDDPLLDRIARGEPAALAVLMREKLPRLLGFAARLLGDRVEAEDVTQEAFVRVWRHAGSWRPGQARFETWLHKVVLNLCRDRLRRRRDMMEVPETMRDPAPDAETSLLALERGQAVAAAIASLPERQREAILLVHYQDLSGPEAAATLGIGVEALESLLARGRRRLHKRLVEQKGDRNV